MDIRSLTIEGQRLRIGVRAGAPHLPPLIVFNGIGASLELIEPFVSALPEREVVAFDVPGSGGSPASLLPYRFPGLARLAHRLLGELGYNGAVDALGVSWGGALAQTFAFQFPTRCRKLVLASTSPGALMVPGRPSVLAKLVSPRRYVDPIVPLINARILSALIRRAELHVVDDGHMFLVSKAQDVAPVVHRFLDEEQEIHQRTRGAGNEHL